MNERGIFSLPLYNDKFSYRPQNLFRGLRHNERWPDVAVEQSTVVTVHALLQTEAEIALGPMGLPPYQSNAGQSLAVNIW